MTARLIVCVLLFGASTLPPGAMAAESSRTDTRGYAVVSAGYSEVASSPRAASSYDSWLTESADASALDAEPAHADSYLGDFQYETYATRSGGVWTEEDFFHRGQFFVQGWLDQGFTWNPASPDSRLNYPLTFNDRANEYQMNQLYLAMGRRVNAEGCKFDVGGRVDLLYGTDYFFTEATGLETHPDGSPRWNTTGPRAGGTAALYGLAMPQLYAEFYMPWRYGTTLKVGHFYSIMGCESVMAPKNFFYSHSYSKQYGEPFTFTGFLASYQYGERLTFHAGMTRGWDSWEDPTDRPGFLGGVSWTSRDGRTNVDVTVTTGDEEVNGQNNRTAYSLVLAHQLSCRWSYVIQHDFGVQRAGAFDAQFQSVPAHWYSVNQYLFYTMTDTLSVGARFEWFQDTNNYRVLGIPLASAVTGKNYYEATVGLNWKPSPRFTLRPELRWDWSDVTPPGDRGMYNDFRSRHQFTLATDLIFLF
ncbi:MAG: porin [Pirellulaceae bacterium]|nr:porin [Pirellulaceae bacterium]